MLFNQLGLTAELLRAVDEQGYQTATPIQQQAIRHILEGHDLLAGAQTGTGKTAGFTLPLLQRLQAEGKRTPADMLITVDAGNLWHAAESGVLASIDSPVLTANVPSSLRDRDGRWFGLSERARTIVYSPERVDPATLSTYEALAEPQWKGRLCLRTSKKVYNQSLVATLIRVTADPLAV